MLSGNLFGLEIEDLVSFVASIGEKPFHGRQIYNWIYKQRIFDFAQMGNLSKNLRENLKQKASVCLPIIAKKERSGDGTIKLLLEMSDGQRIETVYIPDGDRHTACLSSQVGCALKCVYCATGKIGFKRNLSCGEIVAQLFCLESVVGKKMTNVVMMGMGEPLMNCEALFKAIRLMADPDGIGFSKRKISISTSGWLPGIKELINVNPRVKLALSLNATTDKFHAELMPIVARYPIRDLISVSAQYARISGYPLTVGYLLLAGKNDSEEDARRLVKLLNGRDAKVNLMEYNEIDAEVKPSTSKSVERFVEIVGNAGITVTMRTSKGESISGACGQLAAGYQEKFN
ncbi:MAG: 23S rRNA (adenine(2503)-C(2))-methyltransferase RlmN [Calditrichaeota bacterium]|nr:23S rRNA (adenine(2503)-C(2))-methyltransferase RlmN [Calditrichota bacterium]MBT7789162.1 23S rRNA (adenine(2503)-C(2))-methyltransferase RlmN [Calditrichota bacterium]